jgi:hypothetical protein
MGLTGFLAAPQLVEFLALMLVGLQDPLPLGRLTDETTFPWQLQTEQTILWQLSETIP